MKKKYVSIRKDVNQKNIEEYIKNEMALRLYDCPFDIAILSDDKKSFIKIEKPDEEIKYEGIKQMSKTIGGEYGWCVSSFDHDKKIMKIMNKIENSVIKSIHYKDTPVEVDRRAAFKVKPLELAYIIKETKKQCFEENIDKIEEAYDLYSNMKYFSCANVLATIIDAESIKQLLYENKDNAEPYNVSQCWKCFAIIANNNFTKKYFNSKEFIKKASVENFKTVLDKTDVNQFHEDKSILRVLTVTYSLLKFFEDSDWKESKENKIPSSINRHWLAHGMYNKKDIKSFDCIKLFVLLYQLTTLYSELRNNEEK